MFKPAANFLAILTLLGATACVATPHPSNDAMFITNTHAASVAFRSLRIENGTDGQPTVVKGQIHLTGRDPVYVGHVDYAVLEASGKVREQGWVEHTSAIRLRQAHRPSLFSINLQQPLAQGEKVQLTYHIGNH
ncbi:MAG: hypothetical protein R3E93_02355 [Thiothrix sp.]